MATRFATESQWNADPSPIPAGDYCFVLPDNFTGTAGVFRFKLGALPLRRFAQLPWAPNPAYVTLPETAFAGLTDAQLRAAPVQVVITPGATPSGLNLEATQLDVLAALQQFQFDGSGNLKTTGGGGGGGGLVDQGAAGVDPWLVEVTNFPATQPVSGTVAVSNFPATQPVSGPLTDAELRLTPVPVSLSGTIPVSGTVNQGNAGVSPWLVELSAGAAVIGHVITDSGSTTAVTGNVTVVQPTGSNLHTVLDAGSAAIGTVEVTKTPKSTTANTPSIVTSAGDVLASNASRKCWGIQNLGTNVLYVRMATGATSAIFHFALGPGQTNDDGNGGSVANDVYTGVVSIAGTSPRCTVYEL